MGRTLGLNGLLQEETAHSPPLADGISLTVEIRASGLFALGTFQRYVTAGRTGGHVAKNWIGDALAAVRAIDVYRINPSGLVLARRPQAFDVELAAAGLARPQWPRGKSRPDGKTCLGVFGSAEGGAPPFRFVPAAEREERSMPQAPEMC